MDTLDEAAAAARACTLCAAQLPLGPRPVLRVSATARLLIIGQAPGTKVHASGVPWREHLSVRLPLPHPSWRTVGWERANPWFGAEVLPVLRLRVRATLDGAVLDSAGPER